MTYDYQSWLSSQQKDGYLQDVSADDISAFGAYLDEETTAMATISQLVTGKTPADVDKARTKIFYLINNAARDFAETHELLVALRKELLSDSDANTEGYGWVLRDDHDNLQSGIDDAIKQGSSAAAPSSETQMRWANFHAFEAACRTAGTVNVGERFMILSAEHSLEAKVPSEPYLVAAATWLASAAPVILSACRMGEPSGWAEPTVEGRLWKEPNGFSVGRWGFWKKRAEEIREGGSVSDETAMLLRKAFVAMEKAERVKGKK